MKNRKSLMKKIAISIAVTATIAVTIFHFDVKIGNLIEISAPISIDVTTTIHFN